jgi:hypothetical protein
MTPQTTVATPTTKEKAPDDAGALNFIRSRLHQDGRSPEVDRGGCGASFSDPRDSETLIASAQSCVLDASVPPDFGVAA